MACGEKIACKACGRELVQVSGGHRPRQYCNDGCRQAAFRQKREQKHLEEVYQKWAGFTPETQVYLDWLMGRYGEDHAEGVAVVLAREIVDQARVAGKERLAEVEQELAQTKQGLDDVQQRFKDYVRLTNEKLSDQVGELVKLRQERERTQDGRKVEELEQELAALKESLKGSPMSKALARIAELERELVLSQRNLAVCQEKLSQTSNRIQKLERQVEIQRQRLGQSNPQPTVDSQTQRVAELEQELARYRQVVDLSDRQKLQQQLLDTGAQIGYREFLPADTLLVVGQGEEFWRSFAEYSSNEELATAVARAKYYAANVIWVDAQAEVQRLKAQVRTLERQVKANGTPLS